MALHQSSSSTTTHGFQQQNEENCQNQKCKSRTEEV